MAAAAKSREFQRQQGIVTYGSGEEQVFADLVDNTVIIPKASAEALDMARGLGAKIFVFGGGGDIQFERDMIVPLDHENALAAPFSTLCIITGEAARGLIGSDALSYDTLQTEFFEQAAFTDGKQEEYKMGLADKYCRFNNKWVNPIVVMGEDDKPMAIARVVVVGGIAYLSDEIVKSGVEKSSDTHQQYIKLVTNIAVSVAKDRGAEVLFLRAAKGREVQYTNAGATTVGAPRVIHAEPTAEFSRYKKAALEEATAIMSKSAVLFDKKSGPEEGMAAEPC